MTNGDIQAAWGYHNATKHSYESVRTSRHILDWKNYPRPFKIYSALEPIPLPREWPQTGMAALSAIADKGKARAGSTERPAAKTAQAESLRHSPDLATLAQLLYFSAGITRTKEFPGGEIHFRAASCTGALYEIELYVVCGDLPGLPAGVYHFNPGDFALRRLRAGDSRGALMAATNEPGVRHAPVILVSTGTYWRNAWKYQARTYRHFGWDNGTLHANLLATCAAHGLPARVLCGFVDDDVNRLLALDTQREVALTLVPLGHVDAEPPAPPQIPVLHFETVSYSKKEVDYPEMRAMHAASLLDSADEVSAWRKSACARPPDELRTEKIFPLEPFADDDIPRDTIEQVILRRGSSRKFARQPVTFREFSTVLDRSTRGIPADFLAAPHELLNDLYVIVHAVDGLAPGAYFFDCARGALVSLKEGNFRDDAYYLGLEQDLPAGAAAALFYMADLRAILERFGNRGYRAVQLEAGILGGKLYLAAYAQRLGATGLTFYDDEVTEFFSPHAASKSAIFLMAVGHSAKRSLVMPK